MTADVVQNVRPRPAAWLQFLGFGGGGIALFYGSSALAREGAARWDAEEQVRVCQLIGKGPRCPEGFPHYEAERTRRNVFLNFNLGPPPERTIKTVVLCVVSASSTA
jgi:hypothetical protein